jgi:LysM repeat protein
MGLRIAVGLLVVAIIVLIVRGTLFGGGDDSPPSVARRGSIPTATPPADQPEPVLLGEAQGPTGSTTTGGAGGGTYVVKSGDTLGGIASQLGIPVDQQAAWIAEVLRLNNIADARLLQSGVELQLPRTQATSATATRPAGTTPTATRAATTATPGASATPRPTVAGGGGTYTVQDGDYPLLIAEKLGVPEAQRDAWVQQLLALNNVSATQLFVGQVLQLPAGTPAGGAATATPTRTPVP